MISKISFTVLLVLQSSKTALKHPDGTGPIARIDASLRVTVGLGPQLAGSGQARISQPVWKFEAAGGGKNYRDAVDTTPPPRSAEAALPSRFTRCRPYAPNRPGPRPPDGAGRSGRPPPAAHAADFATSLQRASWTSITSAASRRGSLRATQTVQRAPSPFRRGGAGSSTHTCRSK